MSLNIILLRIYYNSIRIRFNINLSRFSCHFRILESLDELQDDISKKTNFSALFHETRSEISRCFE